MASKAEKPKSEKTAKPKPTEIAVNLFAFRGVVILGLAEAILVQLRQIAESNKRFGSPLEFLNEPAEGREWRFMAAFRDRLHGQLEKAARGSSDLVPMTFHKDEVSLLIHQVATERNAIRMAWGEAGTLLPSAEAAARFLGLSSVHKMLDQLFNSLDWPDKPLDAPAAPDQASPDAPTP